MNVSKVPPSSIKELPVSSYIGAIANDCDLINNSMTARSHTSNEYMSGKVHTNSREGSALVGEIGQTITIIADNDLVSSNIECSICLSRYYKGVALELLGCGHFYHLECYEKWRVVKGVEVDCPECRASIVLCCARLVSLSLP